MIITALSVAFVLADSAQAAVNTPPKITASYPSDASDKERQALDRLATEIEGTVIYTRRGRVKKVTIGDWRVVDLGKGDFVRWGPLGKRIAVLNDEAIYVMNADGSDRKKLVDGDVNGGDGCQIEFHTNGREILYGTWRKGVWAVDIHNGKKRELKLPFNTELNISADARRLVGRRGDCFLVELPGTRIREYAGGCSPCVSPDGKRMTSNKGGHRTMDIREWNGKRLFEINARNMQPDRRWDNMHWSNHNDFITMQGDGKNDEAYAFRISENQGTRLTWEGRTVYPDLFVSKDLKTGKSPMQMTLAWAESKDGQRAVASAPKPVSKKKAHSKQTASSGDAKGRATEVRALTGGPTRVVWCQSVNDAGDYCATGKGTRLLGFCTEDGKGERVILSDVTSYAKPIFTPDGQRIVYSDRTKNKMYIVNWDGSGHEELGSGYASDVWRDPSDGAIWLYYRSGDGKQGGPVMRQRLNHSGGRELVWNKTPTGHNSVPWFRLSADGTHFADAFPWNKCGVAEPTSGKWNHYSKGCWPSMAPDNSYSFFVFRGNHRKIGFYEAGKQNPRDIDISGAPGIAKKEVYYPRWSNDVRFLTITGPRGSNKEEVFLGRFNKDFTKVEKWARISQNDNPDSLGDAWIKSGWLAKLNQEPTHMVAQKPTDKPAQPKVREDLSKFTEWPGDQSDLVFLWENNSATNQIMGSDNHADRLCQAVVRGRAVFGRFYEMDLAGGAVVAQDVDADLLNACKRSNELTIEATITPGDVTQNGPANIVSFSKDTRSRNFTLGQEKDTLVLRLRTPRTGSQGNKPQLNLCKVKARRPYHVVVTYQPGRLICYVDGKQVLSTDRVNGDFSNWEPMHLLFGDEWNGGRDWNGSLEGVAIYAREISEAEAQHKHKLFATRLSKRQPIERLVVNGKLLEITPTPTVKDLKEYSRGLVIYSYEVRDVLKGREQAKKIQVAHWALLDREKLPQIGQRKIGEVYELQLESYDKHPQLESERSFNDCEDFDISLYYDIAGRGVPAAPTMVADAMPANTAETAKAPKIHLKVNCAGPSLDDWESDDKYVARRARGDEFQFKRKADTSKVSNPAPVAVYKTVRHRPHRYDFDVPNGEYLVRLHFTDDYDPEGEIRKMDFVIEDQCALKGFNIVASAGGVGKAVVREIPVRVSDGNGLQIKGEDPKGGDVFAAGIEIVSR